MERRNVLGILLVGFLLILGCTKAQENGSFVVEMVTDPTGNINLAPFIKIKSAYECLQNVDSSCPKKYQLTTVGWVNVTPPDTGSYCKACANSTRAVLWCIYLVMRDYKFQDGTTVGEINTTVTQGCHGNFTGKVVRFSGAGMVHASKTITFISAFVAWLLVYRIHM